MADPAQTPQPQPIPDLDKKLDNAANITMQKIQQDPAAGQKLAVDPAMQKEVVEVEKELLNEIVQRLNQKQMTQPDAQKLAKEFIALLPIQHKKDLLEKLKKLSQTNIAASGIYLKYAKEEEETETQRKLTLMSRHLQAGNIEHAITVAKGGSTNV